MAIAIALAVRAEMFFDLEQCLAATRLLLQGISPYGATEFFYPPWATLVFLPFAVLPVDMSPWAWRLSMGTCMLTAVFVIGAGSTMKEKARILLLTALCPAVFCCYLSQQVVPLVGLAAAVLLLYPDMHPVLAGVALAIAATKPHLVAIPLLLYVVWLVQERAWRRAIVVWLVLTCFVVWAFIVLPSWPFELIGAWLGGSYQGYGRGTPSIGLRELGVPAWLALPLALYACGSVWKHGLTQRAIALAVCAGLLAAPYMRQYDLALLALPVYVACRLRRWNGWLAAVGWLFVPLTPAWAAAPAVVAVALLCG